MADVRDRGFLRWVLLALAVTWPAAANAIQASASSNGEQNPPQQAGDAGSADTAFREGYAAVQRNDLVSAEAAFANVVRLSPGVAAGHSAYGSVLLSLGKLEPALYELEKAHVMDPAEPTATLNLARGYQQAGQAAKSQGGAGCGGRTEVRHVARILSAAGTVVAGRQRV